MRGFYRLAAVVPVLKVGDPPFNADKIMDSYSEAVANGASIVVFPELSITGYSCGDMFGQSTLIDSAMNALSRVVAATRNSKAVLIVGLPLRLGSRLFNAAAVISGGKIAGLPFKEYLPNYLEFQEKRYFSSARDFDDECVKILGYEVPAGSGLVFNAGETFRFGVEISEDLLGVIPPSSNLALGGAQAVFNLSAFTEQAGKAAEYRSMILNQSARIQGAYIFAGAGVHESTADVVFAGRAIIADNGKLLAENEGFSRKSSIIYADFKPDWCDRQRAFRSNFNDDAPIDLISHVEISPLKESPDLGHARILSKPFVPENKVERSGLCHEVLEIQAAGLAKRIEHTRAEKMVVGVSGGLDSTLAMQVCARACDLLHLPRTFICAVSMPGFGTSGRTKENAEKLVHLLGAELRTIPIFESVTKHFEDIGHDPEQKNVVFENAQARERTQILMDLANSLGGIVVGTGDLSEIALGWNTFNADHMSMYNVNCSVSKTLVRAMIGEWAEGAGPELSAVLTDILDTPVSPELLPDEQHTESIIGKYDLHDFFLYYFVKFGEEPDTLTALAEEAFRSAVKPEEIKKALSVFIRRFVSQQFKRNAAPDGPKTGEIGLSQRTDWKSPSDMSSAIWSTWI